MILSRGISGGRLVFRQSNFPPQARHFALTSTRGERHRQTLSSLWVPTGGIEATKDESGHDKLIRAGFLRQSQSGIFHMLPLGSRVQDKIERLLDKHMQSIGASRLSLSSISSEELWQKTGRYESASDELFKLHDRRGTSLVLSPTHEEEVTSLVASTLKSYKDLPIRLYQITRKYRDELRPRHGLLRAREFIMKDLYTFDLTYEAADETYRQVAKAYRAFFSDLNLPVVAAEASSGDMGGDLSHEYHLPHPTGEDKVARCNSCDYTANEEVARHPVSSVSENAANAKVDIAIWHGISKDRKTVVRALYPRNEQAEISLIEIKKVVPDLDTAVVDTWKEPSVQKLKALGDGSTPRIVEILDTRLASFYNSRLEQLPSKRTEIVDSIEVDHETISQDPEGKELNLLTLSHGDPCPKCFNGNVEVTKALELGHTFYLGTRYSVPLNLAITTPSSPSEKVHLLMGCHGVGISRIFGAVAEHLADEKGLKWPRAIAPFEVVIVPSSTASQDVLDLYDRLGEQGAGFDVLLDDRKVSFGWKMRDADTIGYPVSVILGKAWRDRQLCEVQCRALDVKQDVAVDQLAAFVKGLLEKI